MHSLEALQTVLAFVYTGSVEVDSLHALLQVFSLADYLQISSLRDRCEDLIFSSITNENCIQLANFSHSCSTIISSRCARRALEFLMERWNYVILNENWTDLKFEVFHKLIISDTFNVKNEAQVLQSVLDWVSACPSRSAKLPHLLQEVRLHILPESTLHQLESHPLVSPNGDKTDANTTSNEDESDTTMASSNEQTTTDPSSPSPLSLPLSSCRRMIDEARYFASNIKHDTTAIKLRPRTYLDSSLYLLCHYERYPREVLYPKPDHSFIACPRERGTLERESDSKYCTAYNGFYNNCNLLSYSKLHDAWSTVLEANPRCWALDTAVTSLGDSIYLLGNRQWRFGRSSKENEVYDKVVSFDGLSRGWTVSSSRLNCPVIYNAAGSVSGRLFSCGGFNLNKPDDFSSPTMLVSTEDCASWETVRDMTSSRRHHVAAALGDKVYVAGGNTEGSDMDTEIFRSPDSEFWDATTNTWAPFPGPQEARGSPRICSTGERLFIFGGFDIRRLEPNYSFESYDPRLGRWESPLPIAGKYTDFTVGCLEGEIYQIGGYTGIGYRGEELWSRDVSILDLRTLRWRPGTPLPLRKPPDLDEVESVLREVEGGEIPSIPIPSSAVVLS